MDMDTNFPLWALLPKKETGVTSFLSKFPEYDGRGVKIAIFDSGIDPGAPGMQITSHGLPKIIDRIDVTGAGDVDTSTVVEKQEGGYIIGLTGRHLKIPETWNNPTGKYHIGVKNAFDLYVKSLKERVQKERKQQLWDRHFKPIYAEVTRKLNRSDNGNSDDSEVAEKQLREELEAQMEVLTILEKKFDDAGPVFDCVVFHDGQSWRAVMDTTETGELAKCKVLGNYRDTFEYATISTADMMNYSVNIRNEGNLLEVVGSCSGHGTHVACIAAAFFPEEPLKNGVAPGAQLISVTIGDSRLGTMETGTAIVRAIIAAIEAKVDVINMSYGEPTHWTASGRIGELMNELIHKHGTTLVSSAGNRGPALSTVVAPPVLGNRSIIGVGAYVSPEMMAAEYSLREKLPATVYTWSSRGPSIDGDLGISVCAPGGAITSVPNWTLRGSQLMNGTSMSSPHACGAIALLMSGLKSLRIPYSPCSIKRSIENSAQPLDTMDYFAQGHGLLQVEKAFDILNRTANCCEYDIHFNVNCGGNSHGIYIREVYRLIKPTEYSVMVEPLFINDANADPQRKINFDMKLVLTCDATWVSIPSHLDLAYSARSFNIKIDPLGLPFGLHHASVAAFDVACPQKGPVFRIPITVVKPQVLNESSKYQAKFREIPFRPGYIHRQYFVVPDGATQADLSIQLCDPSQEAKFVIHAIQLQAQSCFKTVEFYKMVQLFEQSESMQSFKVNGTAVLEVVLAKWWTSPGDVRLNYSIRFHGLLPDQKSIVMCAADGVHRLNVSSFLHYDELVPNITLKHHVQVLRPCENKINALGARDIFPDGRQIYEIQLTYNVNVSKATDVTPTCPLLCELLYESEYESQLWMIFNSNKRLICSGDAYPSSYTTKLEKGNYVMKLHVRHEKKEFLEKLVDLVVHLNFRLLSSITMDSFPSYSAAMIGGKKITSVGVPCGVTVPVYVAPLPTDKVPKNGHSSHFLTGTISYKKDESGKKTGGFPFKYVLLDSHKKLGNNKETNKDKEKLKTDEFSEALRNFKISLIQRMDVDGIGTELYNEVAKESPDSVPLILARVTALNADPNRQNYFKEMITLLNKAISTIPEEGVLAFMGQKSDSGRDASKTKCTMEKQKSSLIDALALKGVILGEMIEKNSDEEEISSLKKEFSDLSASLLKFVEPTDAKAISCFVSYHITMGFCGKALKLLHKQMEEKQLLELEAKCIKLYRNLNWDFVSDFLESTSSARYPPHYRLF